MGRWGIPFVTTQITMLLGMANVEESVSGPHWQRFFDLYFPAMASYAERFVPSGAASTRDGPEPSSDHTSRSS